MQAYGRAVRLAVVNAALAGDRHSVLRRPVGAGFTDVDGRLTAAQLARQQAIVRRYATALLDRYLRGSRPAGRVLTACDAAAQGDDLTLATRPR